MLHRKVKCSDSKIDLQRYLVKIFRNNIPQQFLTELYVNEQIIKSPKIQNVVGISPNFTRKSTPHEC